MCRKVIGVLVLIALLQSNFASATQYAFQVNFTDKNNTPFSLSSPLAYLSARSIARRTAQGISIDSTDIPVNASYISSVLSLTGGELHESSRWLNMCVILLSDSTQIHTLDGKPYISSTKLIAFYSGMLHRTAGVNIVNNTISGVLNRTTSGDAAYYGNTWIQTTMVNGNILHDKGYDGAGKLIAVLDAGFTGVDTLSGFNDLRFSGRLLDSHNFTLASDNIYNYDDHGTKVLSTMAGYVPNTFVGTAPLASYALYITEDGNSEQRIELINMLCGAERADSLGADVITTSLGYDTFDDPATNFVYATDFDGKSTVAAQAANLATKKGILFVASAGNEGGGPWNMVLTPGDADSALTIGSVDNTGANAPTSGFGPNAAGQVKPDVCGMGRYASIFSNLGYGAEDGTSFSTPQIAGWAACLWEGNPGATPYQIRQAIIHCASFYSSPGTQIGYGIPNFECTEQLLDVRDPRKPFDASLWVTVSPNPFPDQISIYVTPDTDQYVDITIIDMAGKIISATHTFFYKGSNQPLVLSTALLPPGIYLLKAVSRTNTQVVRVQKM